jgi:hypothetical protein
MTSIVEDERATAVHIMCVMCSRETASTEEIMWSKLLKYVWKNLRAQASITESRGSQLGGAPEDGVV